MDLCFDGLLDLERFLDLLRLCRDRLLAFRPLLRLRDFLLLRPPLLLGLLECLFGVRDLRLGVRERRFGLFDRRFGLLVERRAGLLLGVSN